MPNPNTMIRSEYESSRQMNPDEDKDEDEEVSEVLEDEDNE